MNAENLYERVQKTINSLELQRNIRGQVRAALYCLPLELQKHLACDFAEHGLRILLATDQIKLSAFLIGLEEIRKFLKGKTVIQQVQKLSYDAIDLDIREIPGISISVGEVSSILRALKSCCCQRELEAAGLMYHRKRQSNVFFLAENVCYAVAQHSAGPDWDSEDPITKKEARKRGYQASEQEAIWQREHILKFLLEDKKE